VALSRNPIQAFAMIKTSSFHEFIRYLGTLDYRPLMAALVEEIERVRHRHPISDNGVSYLVQLKQLLHFMQEGTKPGGVMLDDWQAYRGLTQALVDRGRLAPEALAIFQSNGPACFG
jgi:hypothetical protein